MADFLEEAGKSLLEGGVKRLQQRLNDSQLHPRIEEFKGLNYSDSQAKYLARLDPQQALKAMELFSKYPQYQPGASQPGMGQGMARPLSPQQQKLSETHEKEYDLYSNMGDVLNDIDGILKQGKFETGLKASTVAGTPFQSVPGIGINDQTQELHNLMQALVVAQFQAQQSGSRGSDFLRKSIAQGKLNLNQSPGALSKILERIRREIDHDKERAYRYLSPDIQQIKQQRNMPQEQQQQEPQSNTQPNSKSFDKWQDIPVGKKFFEPSTEQWFERTKSGRKLVKGK